MPIAPQITVTPEDIDTKNFDITAVTYTSTTATYTAVGHTFSTGQIVLVSGIFPDEYNGTFTLTAVATNTFTVANSTNLPVTDPLGNAFWADTSEYSYEDLSAVYGADSDDLAVIDEDIAGLDEMVSQKIQSYYQLTPPSGGTYTVGDLWFDTDDGNKQYRWDGTNWISVQDGTIATKNRTYYSATAPTGTFTAGDIWFDTSTGNKPYRWSGSSWVSVQDASIATALSTANAAQDSANGKNKIIYSVSAASGTGTTVGDVWWQYNGSGQIIAQWEWNGSSWVSKTIGSAVIANIDAGKITAGTISVAISLEAATITGGSININNGNFVVTNTGAVSINAGAFNINSGTFQVSNLGSVTATSGTIGGWVLNSTALSSPGSNKIVLQSSNNAISFTNSSSQVAHIVPLNSSGLLMHYGATADPNGGAFPQMYVGSSNALLAANVSNYVSANSGGLGVQIVGTTTLNNQTNYPGIATGSGSTMVVVTTGSRMAYTTSSERFKQEIQYISTSGWLDKVLSMKPITYKTSEDFTVEGEPNETQYGFLAEDIYDLGGGLEKTVVLDPLGDPFSLSYDRLTVFLMLAIKELKQELDQLKGN